MAESSFNPQVLTSTGPGGNIRIVDPNPIGETVPHEDLFTFVSLVAKQRSKSVITQDFNDQLTAKNDIKNSINLVTPQERVSGTDLFQTKPNLTTDWTDIGGFKAVDLGKDYESFGITNIDIEIKSVTTPKIVIDFVDVRGATLFEQGSCSPYGLFFNLPYPIFELTVKGYYGRPVKYYLNLTKFNTKFNSDTGNMECRAEFIGWSFAFLSDMIVSYIGAAQQLPQSTYNSKEYLRKSYENTWEFYTKNKLATGDNPFCDNPDISPTGCVTILDILRAIDRINEKELPYIKGSTEFTELQNLLSLQSFYSNYKESVFTLINDLKSNKSVNSVQSDKTTKGDVRFVFNNNITLDISNKFSEYFDKQKGLLKGLITNIKTLEITSGQYGDSIVDVLTSLKKSNFENTSQNLNELYNSNKIDGWQKGILTSMGYKDSTAREISSNEPIEPIDPAVDTSTGTTTSISYIDFGYLLNDIDNEESKIVSIIREKRGLTIDSINNIIEKNFGFKPSIRNIFTVLMCNTESFIEILLQVAENAERYHEQETADNRYSEFTQKDGSSEFKIASNDKKVYAWPTYYEMNFVPDGNTTTGSKQGTKEVYPGNGKNPVVKNWVEVKFIEDFITAFLNFEKEIDIINDKTDGKVGYDNYAPITTLEAPISYKNKMIYSDLTQISELDTLYKTIGERLYISMDHTYMQPERLSAGAKAYLPINGVKWNPFLEENGNPSTTLASSLGKIDAWNLLNSQEGSSGILLLSAIASNNPSATDFIDKVKQRLGSDGDTITSLSGGTIISYRPQKGFITLTSSEAETEVNIYSNPFKMLDSTNSGVNNVLRIFNDGIGTDRKIEITNDSFIQILDEYKISLTTNFPEISDKASDFKVDNTVNLDEGQKVPDFKNKNIFISLACSNAKEKDTWWDTGDLNQIKPYWLTYFTAIDTLATDEAFPVSIKAGSGYKINNNKVWGLDLTEENSRVSISGRTANFSLNTSTTDFDANGNGLIGGVIDSFVTTPVWCDNINSFRQLALSTPLVPDKTVTINGELPSSDITQNRNLAYLFLHLLKPSPLIVRGLYNRVGKNYDLKYQEDGENSSELWSIKNFNISGGVIKAPKAWVLALGAQLWRWKEFVGTQVINGKTVWNKPITGQKPTGFDPLSQPGFNATKGIRNDIVSSSRNDINTYLTRVYGSDTNWSSKIQSSSFSNDYQSVTFGTRINSDVNISFDYYGVYKNKINNDTTDYGNWNGNIPANPTQNRAATATSFYSWPSLWISPHHIPYTHPLVFDKNSWFVDAPETYIQLFNSSIGDTDYQTIMPIDIIGNGYDESISKATKNTRRNRSLDGDLGNVIQHLPDEIKEVFVKEFTDWCESKEWTVEILPTIDPVHFPTPGQNMTTSYKLYSKVDDENREFLDEWAGGAFLLQKDKTDIVQKMFQEYIIVNSTPKIWFGMQEKDFGNEFIVTKDAFDVYLTSFHEVITGNAKNKRIIEISKNNANTDSVLSDTSLDDDDVKLSLYRTFKSLTDKWISSSRTGKLFFNILEDGQGKTSRCSGININEKPTLASHFQYVNRTMGDIGNDAVIDATKLNELKDNKKISLYQYISDLLTDNEYLFFPLPSYINFSADGLDKSDLEDMFRPTMNLDKVSCGPSFLSMYVGGNSRQLNYTPKSNCDLDYMEVNFEDDSFNISTVGGGKPSEMYGTSSANGNDDEKQKDVGFTAFKVVYGLENQNHFKNIQLDQSEFSETAESLLVIDKLAQQGGTDQTTKGQNLNSVYLTRSYTCQMESLGNMMIQPMTYFDLFGVPMFNGAYLITEVRHNIKPNHATTTFKGTRQPRATVPLVTNAAVAMNMSLKNIEAKAGKSLSDLGGGGKPSNTTTQTTSSAIGKSVDGCRTAYPELPFQDYTVTYMTYSEAVTYLKSKYGDDLGKAIFGVLWAESAKSKDVANSFVSAGQYNYAGVQTDNARWGIEGLIIGQFCRVDSGNKTRAFASFENNEKFLDFMASRIKAKGFTSNPDNWVTVYINKWWSPKAKAEYTIGTEKYNQKLAIFNAAVKKFDGIV